MGDVIKFSDYKEPDDELLQLEKEYGQLIIFEMGDEELLVIPVSDMERLSDGTLPVDDISYARELVRALARHCLDTLYDED